MPNASTPPYATSLQGRFIAALTGVDVEGMKLQAVAGAPSALEMSELRLLAHKSKRALEAAAGVAAKASVLRQPAFAWVTISMCIGG